MARGYPAFWGTILGVPFGLGAYLYLRTTQYPRLVAVPLLVVGGAVFVSGLFLQLVAPGPSRMRADESLVAARHPRRIGTHIRLVMGGVVLTTAAYVSAFTSLHAAVPIGGSLLGAYLFGMGLFDYWRTTLQTYYLTDRRLISVYRFLSLDRTELPLDEISGVRERKSVPDTLTGTGSVTVASGGGRHARNRTPPDIASIPVREPTANPRGGTKREQPPVGRHDHRRVTRTADPGRSPTSIHRYGDGSDAESFWTAWPYVRV